MKWFQLDADTPHDPTIRRVIRETGNEGFGALVRLWCFVAAHGAEPGRAVGTNGRAYSEDDLADACGLDAEKWAKLRAICLETNHFERQSWDERQEVFIPAQSKRADEFTKKLQRDPEIHLSRKAWTGGPTRRAVFAAFKWSCNACRANKPDGKGLEIDRIVPGDKGGIYEAGNVTVLCESCNRSKGTREVAGLTSFLAATECSGVVASADLFAPSTVQDTTVQDTTVQRNTASAGASSFAALWNEVNAGGPFKLVATDHIPDKWVKHIGARLKEYPLQQWRVVFERMKLSGFLRGEDGGWCASFDWIIKSQENAVKVLAGKYDGRKAKPAVGQTGAPKPGKYGHLSGVAAPQTAVIQ